MTLHEIQHLVSFPKHYDMDNKKYSHMVISNQYPCKRFQVAQMTVTFFTLGSIFCCPSCTVKGNAISLLSCRCRYLLISPCVLLFFFLLFTFTLPCVFYIRNIRSSNVTILHQTSFLNHGPELVMDVCSFLRSSLVVTFLYAILVIHTFFLANSLSRLTISVSFILYLWKVVRASLMNSQ